MLRLLVLVLLLANAAFYAWSQGMLDGIVGVRAQGDREPERLARQVNPGSVLVIKPGGAASAASGVDAGALPCLEAGPFASDQIDGAVTALGSLPADSWRSVRTDVPGAWIVYMGKYPNREAMQKKEDELKRIRVGFEEVRGLPELDGGLALGRFDNPTAADQALADLTQRGVRTARVVMLNAPTAQYVVRIDKATPAVQTKLAGLSSLLGKTFAGCQLPKN